MADRHDDTEPLPAELQTLQEADTTSPIPGSAMPPGYGSYERFRGLFEQSPLPMAVIDLATRTSFPNGAYLHLFGYDSPGAPPFDITLVTHPRDRAATDEAFRRLAHGEVEALRVNKRYVAADGSEFPGQLHATVLWGDAGEPWAILTVVQDLTERYRSERRVADSERRLQALVDNITDAVLVLDGQGRISYFSPSAARLIGRPDADHIGVNPFELVHPDDADQVARSFLETAARPGPAPPLRFRIVRPDGSRRLVEAVAVNRLDDPAVAGVVITMRDMTDDERVATALEASEARFRRMLENISDTVTLVGPGGDIIATSGNVRETLGYPSEYWSDRNAFDFVHPDDIPIVAGLQADALAHPGVEVAAEFRTTSASGEVIDVEASAVNLLDDPAVGAIVITTRNITPRKQIERELSTAHDAALRELEIRNEFIASVSHELRTPIHGILGLTELLATAELDKATGALAAAIGRATDTLKMVLDDLLDFSKMEAGRLEVVWEAVDLDDLLTETTTLFRPQAEAKGIALRVERDERLPTTVRGDAFRLRQVLSNLVSNAVKFTASGEVVVRAASEPPPASGAPPVLSISVRDTGIGMAPTVLARLFEPYSQAYASTAREFGGTGLGLAIARRILELLGGTLDVTSEEGRGSTFVARLALEAVDAVASPPPSSATVDDPTRTGRWVLVVEDNSVNQLLIQHQLERLGFESEVVGSGDKALERFRVRPPDAVLMDCQMPVMDGFTTTRRLRRFEQARGMVGVPVIALTANAQPGERTLCLEAGMDDYLAKPVGLAALGAVLARWLGHPHVNSDAGSGSLEARRGDGPTTLPALDADRLATLIHEVGLAPVVGVVRTFLGELPGRLTAVEAAATGGDTRALTGAAHVLRGASAVVGADALAAACEAVERDPADEVAGGRAEALVAHAAQAADALEAWIAAADTGTVPRPIVGPTGVESPPNG